MVIVNYNLSQFQTFNKKFEDKIFEVIKDPPDPQILKPFQFSGYVYSILSSNYQHMVCKIIFVKFQWIEVSFMWHFFVCRAEVNASDIATGLIIKSCMKQ